MAISVAWETGIISVPKSDTVFFGTDSVTGRELRTFDTLQFHRDLRSLLESVPGRPFPNTHSYEKETTIDGVSYASKLTINSAYYKVEFEDGNYRVILINTNNNIATVTVVNSVSIQPTNSAGLVGSEDIRNQSFLNAEVVINTIGEGNPGTAYPQGSPTNPVNNYDDAYIIANQRNYDKYHLEGSLLFTPLQNIIRSKWRGDTPLLSDITLQGNNTDGFVGTLITITGIASPQNTAKPLTLFQSLIYDLDGFFGAAQESAIDGTIKLYNGSVTNYGISFIRCFSYRTGNTKPIIDINGFSGSIQFRGYIGGLKLINCTHPDCKISIDGDGRLDIDNSNTAGEIVIGGKWDVDDNSGINCNIIPNSNITELVGSSTSVWTTTEKNKVLVNTLKASDKAEIIDNKLNNL